MVSRRDEVMPIKSLLAIGFAFCGFPASAANIIFISNSTTAETGYVSFLESNGYNVTFVHSTGTTGYGTLDADKVAALNAADLVIMSRNASSADFSGGTEPTEWNSVTTPLLLHNPYLVRTGNWQWFDTTSAPVSRSVTGVDITAAGSAHPIFAGGATVELFTAAQGVGYTPVTTAGNGTVLATASADNYVALAEWQAGVLFHSNTTQAPADLRVFFPLGAQSGSNLDYFATLSANGQQVLLNTVEYMIPEPSSSALVLIAGMGLVFRRRRAA